MSNNFVYQKKELPSYIGKIGITLLVIGVILGVISYIVNPSRAAFSYLTSYIYLVSIAIGSLFLVALEYTAGATWSTPFRRIVEFLAAAVPLLLIFAIPLLFNIHDFFMWTSKEVVANDKILQAKSAYLNTPSPQFPPVSSLPT